jgi:hypothetical protein
MKTTKWTLLFAFSALTCSVFAQGGYTFKVLANKGSNEVKSGDSWQPLKTGASLRETDEIKIADNAYLGLVHAKGKPMELKQAGTFKVKELAEKVNAGSSVLNKYTDFILSSNSAEAKKNRLSATGAVHRATESATGIKVFMPENQNSSIYNSVAVVKWDGSKVAGPYVVKFLNIFEEEIFSVETPETSLEVDLRDSRFPNDQAYLLVVQSKQDAKQVSKQHMIKKLSKDDQEKVKVSLTEIMSDVQEENAVNKVTLAGFYEQNNLLIDAITAYEDAVRMEPAYQEMYDEFLLRHQLKK